MLLLNKHIAYKTFFLILIFLLAGNRFAFSQNCTQTLRNAQRAYDEGRIAEIPSIVELCLRNGFTKDERVRAYRLLTLSYLYQYESASAEKAMLAFLKEVPDYKLTPEDPAPFVKLYKQFRTWPIFLIGLKAGLNFAQPRAFNGYSPFGNNFSKYSSNSGFLIGFSADIFINDKISFSPSLYYLYSNYHLSFSGLDTNFATVSATVKQNVISIPLVVKYDFYEWRDIKFYAEAGGAVSLILSNSVNTSQTNHTVNIGGVPTPIGPLQGIVSIDSKKLNYSLIAGLGAKYKIGKNYFTVGLKYWVGLNNLNRDPWDKENGGKRILDSGYATDDYRLNNLTCSIGYLFPVYKPKLLKKK